MPQGALGATNLQVIRMLAKHSLDRGGFRFITEWCARSMSIDVVNLLGLNTRVLDSESHRLCCTISFGVGCRDMTRITGGSIP